LFSQTVITVWIVLTCGGSTFGCLLGACWVPFGCRWVPSNSILWPREKRPNYNTERCWVLGVPVP